MTRYALFIKPHSTTILTCLPAAQIAAKAQRASVEPGEVTRYEEYDAKHGAKYIDTTADEIDAEGWGTPP